MLLQGYFSKEDLHKINQIMDSLPDREEILQYADKYFLRSAEILREARSDFVEEVSFQVFARRPSFMPATNKPIANGMYEAIAVLEKYGRLSETSAYVQFLPYGQPLRDEIPIMKVFNAPILNVIELETIYLGLMSEKLTTSNCDAVDDISLGVTERVARVKDVIGSRSLMYFGARHYSYEHDKKIARAAAAGGADACSTDAGAIAGWGDGSKGIGTIPHALENIFEFRTPDSGVVNSTLAFHQIMSEDIPRIALIDYANRELLDTARLISAIGADNLNGVRIDTCGSNLMEGADLEAIKSSNVYEKLSNENKEYFYCNGVSISGVIAVRKLLDELSPKTAIILSSGFANPNKVKAFVEAENILGIRLFDSIGAGQFFNSYSATMDIFAVNSKKVSKAGRFEKQFTNCNINSASFRELR